MFADKGQAGEHCITEFDGLHLIHRDHVIEADVFKHQFQIRIFQLTTGGSWHDQVFDLVS